MKCRRFVLIVAGMLTVGGEVFAQSSYTFISLDVQCAANVAASACPAGLVPGQVAAQTSAKGINAHGDVVGFYVAGGRQHGFLLKDGEYTTVDFPLSGVRNTIANGVNARGEIVGQYLLPVRLKDESGNDLPEDSPQMLPVKPSQSAESTEHSRSGVYQRVSLLSRPVLDGDVPEHGGCDRARAQTPRRHRDAYHFRWEHRRLP